MNTKMRALCFAGVVLALVMASTGCNSTVPAADPTTAVAEVKYVPVCDNTFASYSSRSIQFVKSDATEDDPNGCRNTIKLISPVVIKIGENTKGYKIGDTFTETLWDTTVSTTITQDGDYTVYTGIFPDNLSYYKLSINPKTMKFKYEHVFVMNIDVSELASTGLTKRTDVSVVSISDTDFTSDGSANYNRNSIVKMATFYEYKTQFATDFRYGVFNTKYNESTGYVTKSDNWKIDIATSDTVSSKTDKEMFDVAYGLTESNVTGMYSCVMVSAKYNNKWYQYMYAPGSAVEGVDGVNTTIEAVVKFFWDAITI